jgi:hypothetical protein
MQNKTAGTARAKKKGFGIIELESWSFSGATCKGGPTTTTITFDLTFKRKTKDRYYFQDREGNQVYFKANLPYFNPAAGAPFSITLQHTTHGR